MSVQYLLDGYNILNQLPALAQKKLEDRRSSLIRLIEIHRPQGSLNNTVTVVFDGKAGIWGGAGEAVPAEVKVLYTADETADEKIKALVAQSRHKKQIVVVTDDRALQYAVRGLGASVVSVTEFLAKMKPSKTGGSQAATIRETSKVIPKTVEYKITSELEDFWLRKKKKT